VCRADGGLKTHSRRSEVEFGPGSDEWVPQELGDLMEYQ